MTTWKDLGWGLKVGIIGGWLTIIVYGLAMIIGLVEGLFGV